MKKIVFLSVFAVVALFVSNNSVFGQSTNCQIDLTSSWAVTPDWTVFNNVPTSVCVGEQVTFSLTLDGTYVWEISGNYPVANAFVRSGNSTSINEVTQNLNVAGNYEFVITLYGTGCNRDTTLYVSVLGAPTNLGLVATGGNQVCAGNEVDYVASATNAQPGSSTYSWFVDSNPVAVADPTSNIFQYTPANGEEISFSVSNGTCEALLPTPVVMTVYDNPTPIASFDDLNLQNHFCDGQVAIINETSGNANISSWEFVIAGTSFVQGVNNYSWNAGAVQDGQDAYVVVTDNNGCIGTSNVLTISVDQLPDLTVTPVPSSTCNGEYMSLQVSGFTGEGTGPWNLEFWNVAHTVQYPIVGSTPVLPTSSPVNVDVDIPYGTPGVHVKIIETLTGCESFQ